MKSQKSFDLVRKTRASAPVKKQAQKVNRERRPAPKQVKSLRKRREDARMVVLIVIALLGTILVGGVLYLLWLPAVRITEITVSSVPDENAVKASIQSELKGKYFGILPRDSIFFYPESAITRTVLLQNPSLREVKLSRDSFDSITLTADARSTSFFWCGASPDLRSEDTQCYEADADGFVFAPFLEASATTSALRVYAPLDSASSTAEYPLTSSVIGTEHLPSLLEFVSAVEAKSVSVLYTSILGDEAELYVTPETSIRYVLGEEESAAVLASAAFPTLNLLDGSIEYVDLRFDGKVYVKRRSQAKD